MSYVGESYVGVRAAKATLSQLLRRVASGEEIVITRDGVPVARLLPMTSDVPRTLGEDRGRYEVPEDFNEPLPEELLTAFKK